ncbi:hypothetical protein DPEC_G00341780 [Dallia pectoralis]|uniref:Uncharacterized protein n=1 Tax=Dallia pectoralis TaxID=75939 RepID=A0ACC2F5I6_DALPE|nr:hypothetical protein DPEC_G00341780 [Dallia pectoralis]
MLEAGLGLNKQEAWTRSGKRVHPNARRFFHWPELERRVGADPYRAAASIHKYKATSSHTGPVTGSPLGPGLIAQFGWRYGGADSEGRSVKDHGHLAVTYVF